MAGPIRPLPRLSEKDVARFWAKVDKGGPDDCWPRSGANHGGYSTFTITSRGRTFKASRISYFLATGKDPFPLQILHHCDNPPCVNPAHLYAGTASDNIRDKVIRGRDSKTRGAAHWKAKLNDMQVRVIWHMSHESDLKQGAIAHFFGVSHGQVSAIKLGRCWTRWGRSSQCQS